MEFLRSFVRSFDWKKLHKNVSHTKCEYGRASFLVHSSSMMEFTCEWMNEWMNVPHRYQVNSNDHVIPYTLIYWGVCPSNCKPVSCIQSDQELKSMSWCCGDAQLKHNTTAEQKSVDELCKDHMLEKRKHSRAMHIERFAWINSHLNIQVMRIRNTVLFVNYFVEQTNERGRWRGRESCSTQFHAKQTDQRIW